MELNQCDRTVEHTCWKISTRDINTSKELFRFSNFNCTLLDISESNNREWIEHAMLCFLIIKHNFCVCKTFLPFFVGLVISYFVFLSTPFPISSFHTFRSPFVLLSFRKCELPHSYSTLYCFFTQLLVFLVSISFFLLFIFSQNVFFLFEA